VSTQLTAALTIKMHSTRSWIKCVSNSSISYFVVCYSQRKIFNTTQLLHHMALSIKLIIKCEQSDTDNYRVM